MIKGKIAIGTRIAASSQGFVEREASSVMNHSGTIPAAKAGALSTRLSNTTGTLTMLAGHGLTTGVLFDLYWAGGRRMDCLAGTVNLNSVPFSLGIGDDLPAQATVITACVLKYFAWAQSLGGGGLNGADVKMFLAMLSQRGRLYFSPEAEASGYVHVKPDMKANEPYYWYSEKGNEVNPLAVTNALNVGITQASLVAATFSLGILFDGVV